MKTSTVTRHQLLYGDETIHFECRLRPQASAKILIKVFAEGRVIVLKPATITDAQMQDAVEQRKRWIYEKLCDFKAQQYYIAPRTYASGESFYYLGRRYRLKNQETAELVQQVKCYQGQLFVLMKKKTQTKAKQLLQQWYAKRAEIVFAERMEVLLKQVSWVKHKPKISIKRMKTRWGSCSATGNISLNTHLVKASKVCIDYVIMHELCHLVEHNHSPAFYALLDQVMPDWRQVKKQLDSKAHAYLIE